MYGSRELDQPIPRNSFPKGSLPPSVVAQLITDELNLDGNPALNLATFVTTWMEPEARQLMADTLSKNFVDADEYPQSVEISDRCVHMLAELFHAPSNAHAAGTPTVGSSEAIHLAGLALKWRWRAKIQDDPDAASRRPNIVMGANVQVCWEKFAKYFDVEPRMVPLTEERFIIGVPEALALVDENTIGVVGILGSTYTGEYEPIAELASALDDLERERGIDVPIHVDAASGGFVAPFVQSDIQWDFSLERVHSINVSGHKYGMVYPGVGWVIWRSEEYLPEELIFHVNYLGGDHPTFNLNFSRGSSQIIAQYYNFLRLGFDGYAKILSNLFDTTQWLAKALSSLDHVSVISSDKALPVLCLRLSNDANFDVFKLSEALRERGWIVPAYTLAANATDIAVLRIVVREGLSRDLAAMLVDDVRTAISHLKGGHEPIPPKPTTPHQVSGAKAPSKSRAKGTVRGVC